MYTKRNSNIPTEIDKTSPDYIWRKIRGYCYTYHINREQLARVTGLSTTTISAYNNNASSVTLETIHRFCKAYNIVDFSILEIF